MKGMDYSCSSWPAGDGMCGEVWSTVCKMMTDYACSLAADSTLGLLSPRGSNLAPLPLRGCSHLGVMQEPRVMDGLQSCRLDQALHSGAPPLPPSPPLPSPLYGLPPSSASPTPRGPPYFPPRPSSALPPHPTSGSCRSHE